MRGKQNTSHDNRETVARHKHTGGKTMRNKAVDIRRSPTKKTLAYIEALCAYKRTHIEREEARLLELETMRDELLALIDRGKRV